MSASNYSWVCFDCRSIVRQPKTSRRIPKCPECKADCYCLGYKVEIPKKKDVRGWRRLRLECRRREVARLDQEAKQRAREVHASERRIADLRSRGQSRDREKLIADLQQKMHE
jgi:hypothetical protein